MKKFCKVDGVLTVVDCKHFLQQLNRERPNDAVNETAQQVGFADKILLNKVDVCERAHIDETKGVIRSINAFCPIREVSINLRPDEIPIGELLAIEAFDAAKMLTEQTAGGEVSIVCIDPDKEDGHGYGHEGHGGGHEGHGGGHEGGHEGGHGHDENCTEEHGADGGHTGGHGASSGHGGGHGHGHNANRHDTEVKSMVLECAGNSINMHKFQYFLGSILEERAQDLYRYKGVLAVNSNGKTMLYILQGVHDMPELTYSGEWPEGKPIKTQVVLIGRKLDPERYRKEFAECSA